MGENGLNSIEKWVVIAKENGGVGCGLIGGKFLRRSMLRFECVPRSLCAGKI